MYGCRITRFVDGGPENPGQARKSGIIKPGDVVLKVEAEGTSMAGTTYDEIINVLQLSHTKRVITLQPTLENQELTHSTRRGSIKTENRINGIVLQPPSQQSEGETVDEVSLSSSTIIHQSPLCNASRSLTFQENTSQMSPTRNTIMPLEAAEGKNLVPSTKETQTSSFVDTASKSDDYSFSSQDTKTSSNKLLATSSKEFLDNQLFLSDGIMDACEPETSELSTNSAKTTDDNTEYEDNNSETINKRKQAVNDIQHDLDRGDITKLEIKQQQSLFEESLARADYEQRLEIARREHSKAERELKDLYIHTCERNENKIRELKIDRDNLQNTLEASTIQRTLQSNTRIKELERQVAEAEKVKMRTQVEASEIIREKASEFTRLFKERESEWEKQRFELEHEINTLKEESMSRAVELEMSRTMVAEMESQILANESEKDELKNRLENASNCIQSLENKVVQIEEEGRSNEDLLEKTQETLNEIRIQNNEFKEKMENHELFRKESSMLTKKLSSSLQEKQKAYTESQLSVNKLQTENDELLKRVTESTSDVDHLVQEKLLLEDKLAQAWREIEKVRSDALTARKTLIENLENGEYYTCADIEEKDITIQTLERKLKSMNGASNDEIIKSNKKSVILHLELNETKRKLLETKESNSRLSDDRDSWHKKSIELVGSLADAESQILKMTEMYRNENALVNQLKVDAERIEKFKLDSDTQIQKAIESFSLQLESKDNELLRYKEKLDKIESHSHNETKISSELKEQVEAITESKEEAELQYQKSIESLTLQLESKKSELSSGNQAFTEIVAQKKNQEMITSNLEAQLEATARSKDESEAHYQKLLESLTSQIDLKEKEFSDRLKVTETTEIDLKENISSLKAEMEELARKHDDQTEALEVKLQESNEEIEALTDALQTQCEDYSCLEIRSQIFEDDYNTLKLAHEKAIEEKNAILQEKLEAENSHKDDIRRWTLELESKQSLIESTRSDLSMAIDSLASRNKELTLQHREKIEELTKKLETDRMELSNATEKLKQYASEGVDLKAIEELRTKIQSLELENESVSAQYWESIQELTNEMQLKTEEVSSKQAILETMEQEFERIKIRVQELEHENFEKDISVDDLREKVKSQTKLLEDNEIEKLKAAKTISMLQSKIDDLNQEEIDKVELKKSYDTLKVTADELCTSKEMMSVRFTSEIFRLVKRLAILDHTHKDTNEQRIKAMEIAVKQRKWQTQAKLQVEQLEKKLQIASGRASQLENKLKENLNVHKENENKVAVELAEKTKQLEHQNVVTSSLQVEVSSLIRLTNHLQDSKQRELSKLKEANENLQSALYSEKISNARSAGDAYDARMELKMLDKKYSSAVLSNDEALQKSEKNCTAIARSLLHANAVVVSLHVQLSEKKKQVADEVLKQSSEKINLLDKTVCELKAKLENQDIDLGKLTEELKSSQTMSDCLKEDIKQVEGDHRDQVQMLHRQILFLRATIIANYKYVTSLEQKVKISNDQIISLTDARGKYYTSRQISEQTYQKTILMLHAHYIMKHLEVQSLQKDVSNLHEIGRINLGEIDELKENNHKMQKKMKKMSEHITESENQNAQLQQVLSVFDKDLQSHGKESKEIDIQNMCKPRNKKTRLLKNIEYLSSKLLSMEESMKQSEIFRSDIEVSLKKSISKLRAEYVAKHIETNELRKQIVVLRQESKTEEKKADKLRITISDLLAELGSNKITMSQNDDLIKKISNMLDKNERASEESAAELLALREKVKNLESENFDKTSSLSDLSMALESIRDRLKNVIVEKNNIEERLIHANNELCRHRHVAEKRREHIVESDIIEGESVARTQMVTEKEFHHEECERLKSAGRNPNILESVEISRNIHIGGATTSEIPLKSESPVSEDEMSAHLVSVKKAFNIQAAVLDDVKLSESMLDTLMHEVMDLAAQSESEMLELSSALGTIDDLIINPSRILASLDLAGVNSSQSYFNEVRSRLEDLAAIAYKTSVELNSRQVQLTQWRLNRAESPYIPVTPPFSRQITRSLFDTKDLNCSRDITPVITDGSREVRDKVAGARLLCCVLENNDKIKLASAFRKWTCAAGAINASVNASSHKETAVELAHELEITREKLLVLKNHFKNGKGGKQKPRLRRILERLDGNVMKHDENMNPKIKPGNSISKTMNHTASSINECSFEL